MSNKDWKNKEYKSNAYGNYEVERTLYIDVEDNPKYKFMEEIKFTSNNNGKNYAICIGLNPAKAEKELDATNNRLISLLSEDYGGYYLFNIYPEITENTSQINLEDKKNIEFVNELKEILKEDKYTELDIILFFGRTLIIPDEFIELIQQFMQDQKNVYITVHNGEFTHPGSNAKIEKIELKFEYFRKNNCIRVFEKKDK